MRVLNHRFPLALAVIALLGPWNGGLQAAGPLGVQSADGFEVTLYADDDLAHDVFAMTVDAFGRVVVSGPGYVKILNDLNGDGIAETATTFADGPQTGAQGLYFVGRDLLCAGDAGLIRYRDRDGDDRADGPPDLFLKINAGTEHGIHAIRKGPDGWWYVIAGNHAGVNKNYISVSTSPVKDPVAGTLLRLSPDLTRGEVFAHGFRNAYDFDFNALGDILSFDSDDERDISLPWYRENRVFHVTAGSHQGWVSNGWKRPDSFFDMPPVVGSFGRGSPTGMVCYQHTQFPEAFQGAMFVLDWTYGRVLALRLKPNGGSWSCETIPFLSAVGEHGFAPTDAEVGPDGSLYVSVGGRGTRGGVYRIRAKNSPTTAWPSGPVNPSTMSPAEKMQLCLSAPQPLSSWSRRVWEPLTAELKGEMFLQAALDVQRPDAERIRAIEILTEKFNGLGGDAALSLSTDPSAAVRTRAVWSIGRTRNQSPNPRFLEPYLSDANPFVVRAAMESLIGADPAVMDELVEPFGKQLAHPDHALRELASRVLIPVSNETLYKAAEAGFPAGARAAIPVAAAQAARSDGFSRYAFDIGYRLLRGQQDPALQREALRILQLALGDVAPQDGSVDPAFEGYSSRVRLAAHEQELDGLRIALVELYPLGRPELDHELERVLAIIQPPNDRLLGKVLASITDASHPVDDLHHLVVAARIPAQPGPAEREIIVRALIRMDAKIASRNLRQDTHWPERMTELYHALVERDPQLPVALLQHPEFGQPGHVHYLAAMPAESYEEVIGAFSRQSRENPDYPWTSDVVFILAESPDPADRQRVLSKFEDFSLRSAVLMAISESPQETERKYLIAGLDSAPMSVMQACVQALALLNPSPDPVENVLLAKALRKLGSTGEERATRDQVAELLGRNLKEQHGYVLGRDGDHQQAAINTWFEAVQVRFPDEFRRQAGDQGQSLQELREQLATVNWGIGNAQRGHALFQQRSCVQCHGSRTALGPDLAGVAGRFSRDDLFTAIVFPNLDVSPRYQMVQIVTTEGKTHLGMVVYEAVDGLVLRDAGNRTYRIEADDIEFKRPLSQSMMPAGLLKGLTSADLADLYAYLRSLSVQTTAERSFPGEQE